MRSVAIKVIGLYLLIYYFVPLVFGYFYQYWYMDFLAEDPSYLLAAVIILGFSGLLIFLTAIMSRIRSPFEKYRFSIFDFHWINLLLAALFLSSSVFFAIQYGLSYRQSGTPISESSIVVVFLLLFQAYFFAHSLLMLSRLSYGHRFNSIEKLITFISFVSFLLSVSGSFDVIKAICILLIFIGMTTRFNLYFKSGFKGLSAGLFIKAIGGLVAVFATFFVGVANKLGVQRAFESLSSLSFGEFLILPLRRLSYNLYTVAFHSTYSLFDSQIQVTGLEDLWNTFIFRVALLMGFHPDKPPIASFSRLNSLSIYVENNARNGVSPGLIGAPFFFPFFPFNFIFWAVFVVFIANKISDLFSEWKSATLLTLLYSLIVLESVTDSGLEFLNPVSKSGLSIVLLFLVWLARPVPIRFETLK